MVSIASAEKENATQDFLWVFVREQVVWWKDKRRVLIFRHIRLLFCVRKVMP